MFTGIIESPGKIVEIQNHGRNKSYYLQSNLGSELKIDQSLSHNGICLTVEEVTGDIHKVTAISETISKTNIGDWKLDDWVNLERAMLMNSRLDGHIVQGHVDATVTCISRVDNKGSEEYSFQFDVKFAPYLIEKGSICVNGVSLTAYNVMEDQFTLSIIPYTFAHTNFPQVIVGSKANVEFDMIGKYVVRLHELNRLHDK